MAEKLANVNICIFLKLKIVNGSHLNAELSYVQINTAETPVIITVELN